MGAVGSLPGFVLCGGASRRMGRDKAWVEVAGEPLAARTARVLGEGGCGPVVLVGKRPELATLGWPLVREVETDHHPLWGIAAALDSTDAPLVLVAACDLVALAPEHVRALVARGEPCFASAGPRRQPLLAVLPRAAASRARALAAAGASAHDFVRDLPSVDLPAAALANANAPDDLPG